MIELLKGELGDSLRGKRIVELGSGTGLLDLHTLSRPQIHLGDVVRRSSRPLRGGQGLSRATDRPEHCDRAGAENCRALSMHTSSSIANADREASDAPRSHPAHFNFNGCRSCDPTCSATRRRHMSRHMMAAPRPGATCPTGAGQVPLPSAARRVIA